MTNAMISGLGLAVPANRLDNEYFDKRYGKDLSSFLETTRGIRYRHHLGADETTSDLIIPAARQAVQHAGLTADEIDMVLVATDTPDYVSPPTAVRVAHALGIRKAAFDINAACAGFIFGMDLATSYLRARSDYRNILVVGAYGMSKFFNWDDYKVTSVFADGAGAAVLSRCDTEGHGILGSVLGSDGSHADAMGIYGGGADNPDLRPRLEFRKRLPPEMNVELWPDLVNSALDRSGATIEDVRLAFFTQINRDTIFATADRLGLRHDQCVTIMVRYGYTGSACIPMAIYDAWKSGRLRKGDLIVLCASGGGINMGAITLRWSLA